MYIRTKGRIRSSILIKTLSLFVIILSIVLSTEAKGQSFSLYLNGNELNDTNGKLLDGVYVKNRFLSFEYFFNSMVKTYTCKDAEDDITYPKFKGNISPNKKLLTYYSGFQKKWITCRLISEGKSTYTYRDGKINDYCNLVLMKDLSSLIIVVFAEDDGNKSYIYKAIFKKPILVKRK